MATEPIDSTHDEKLMPIKEKQSHKTNSCTCRMISLRIQIKWPSLMIMMYSKKMVKQGNLKTKSVLSRESRKSAN